MLAGIGIWHHVLGGDLAHRVAGARVEAAQQRGGAGESVGAHAQAAGEALLFARQQFEVAVGEVAREGQVRGVGIEQADLHQQALAQVAAGDAGRIEALQAVAHGLDVLDRGVDRRSQRVADRLQRIAQVAVLVQRLDQRLGDRAVARRQRGEVELPLQVVGETLRRGGAGLERVALGVGAGATAARPLEREVLVLLAPFGQVVAMRGLFRRGRRIVGAGLLAGGRRRGHGLALGRGLLAATLVLLQQGVALQRLADLDLEFGRRQLQQADGLAQLRRQAQLLTDPEF